MRCVNHGNGRLTLSAALALLSGCAGAPSTDEATALGSLSVPLVVDVNGQHYRLNGATLTFSGPVNGTLTESEDGSSAFASLPPGAYELELGGDWSLQRQSGSEFALVEADLASANPRPMTIEAEQAAVISYVFVTDGLPVSFANGLAQVNLTVIDRSNPGGEVFGDVLLTGQEHVEAFSGVHSIDGELALGGDVGSLAPLEQLSHVDGDFILSAADVTSVDGLQSLATVGGSLRITGNASLVQLRDLTSLSAVDDIVITDNPSLATCEAHLMVDAFILRGGSFNNIFITGNDDAGGCP
jgi:hypothetical protein